MAIGWEKDLMNGLGEGRMLLDQPSREKLSKDYYWYSPILEYSLKDKIADSVIIPNSEKEIELILKCAYAEQVPVTVRGAGTGNYGQSIPLHGGIVLALNKLDQVLEWGENEVRVQTGVRLGALEKMARERGLELRIYPSTFMKATVGGFVCGGSGGIGSIQWGDLWDGNVHEASLYTLEQEPRRITVRGQELEAYIHNYGTTGILTELVIPLAPRTEWVQSIVSFTEFHDALRFADALAHHADVNKRLISPMEWPIPSYFRPLSHLISSNKAIVLLETEEGSEHILEQLAAIYGGEITHSIAADQYRKGIGLSDFSWNHTTLWGLKCENNITYLQAQFSSEHYLEQVGVIKETFGDEVLLHFEWIRSRGRVVPSSLPIVRYSSEERLNEIIAFFNENGILIFNPHTYLLDSGGRGIIPAMKEKKGTNDPRGLLNPGKMGEL